MTQAQNDPVPPAAPPRQELGPGWLSAATARISGTLDLRQTAAEVATAAVCGFADAAVIYAAERLLTGDDSSPSRDRHGTALRLLAARLAHDAEAAADSLLPPGEVIFLGPDTACAQAMATGEPVASSPPDSAISALTARHPFVRVLTARYRSFLAVPLIARDLTVGCAVFARTPGGTAFTASDIALAAELASRAAVYIDNARLYDRERRTAQALQRGLLPSRPRVPAGIEVAHRYLPAGASVVGGDWHDIVPLPGGRAALVMGDAMGHGPEAAAVMVQLRTAAHTLAALDLPPGQVLGRLDAMAADMDETSGDTAAPPFATCVYAVINPADGTAEITRAGHLPPILITPGRHAAELDLPPGLPLGLNAGAVTFQTERFKFAQGTTLALYTDGLVESRARSVDDGITALRHALTTALAQPGATMDSTCETVVQALRQDGEDDISLMLARPRTDPR